jgi:hypothetical protein
MTGVELDTAIAQAMMFIAPMPTTINGNAIAARASLATICTRLPTELQGDDGLMKRTERQTELVLYEPATGEGRLYELGIPVCTTGDTFDVDVRQKVPLRFERESVTDVYLRRVRSAVLAQASHLIDVNAARTSWISQALEAQDLPDKAVSAVIEQRYGKNVVIYDPSDREANKLAVSKGYAVVHGGAFSAAAWSSIKSAGAMRPAGQVTPSPKPWAEQGHVARPIAPTPQMHHFAQWCQRMALILLQSPIRVEFYQRFNDPMSAAAYGSGCLQFSVSRLGRGWFEGPITEAHVDLLLHEFGHHYESDHLSRNYYKALTSLGARLALAARSAPDILDLNCSIHHKTKQC